MDFKDALCIIAIATENQRKQFSAMVPTLWVLSSLLVTLSTTGIHLTNETYTVHALSSCFVVY